MVDIECERCETVLNDNFKITKCSYPEKGKPGDNIKITVKVKCLNSFFAGDVRVCLYHKDTLIGTSQQVTIQPGFSKTFTFGLIMPDNDVTLNVSLLGQNVFAYDCEDFKDIYIQKSTYTSPSNGDSLLLIAAVIALLVYMESR
ncbi:MAG: hypothetical protein KKH98_04715, partial [Spirochaetes bacterium]|nr:hypothetical protein [Spirochaetota bacterium]